MTAEIARLQNSLAHLKSTQEQLKEATEELSDPELEQAMKENDDVMYVLLSSEPPSVIEHNKSIRCRGSQEERISILRMALAEKGLSISCHSELPTAGEQTQSAELSQENPTQANSVHAPVHEPNHALDTSHDVVLDEDGGIDL